MYDTPHECPYLPGRRARLPMRLPSRALAGAELDARLAEGDRRHGMFLYRTACPECHACEAIRIPLADFEFSRSQRRVLNRGDRELEVVVGEPEVSDEKLALYHAHKSARGMGESSSETLTLEGYRGFLVERCAPAVELSYRHEEKLVGVAVTDRGREAWSLVYCYWDPAYARLGIGTYSILHQARLAQRTSVAHLYLGLYIGANRYMRYKARFVPHERRVVGVWRRFER